LSHVGKAERQNHHAIYEREAETFEQKFIFKSVTSVVLKHGLKALHFVKKILLVISDHKLQAMTYTSSVDVSSIATSNPFLFLL
jgi:hypothetical protein